MWLALLAALASAEMPPPSYRDALTRAAWDDVDALVESGRFDEAIEEAERFQRHVTPDAGLEYLIGLSHRLQGDVPAAERHLRAAIALDPDRAEAWSDLGEILLAEGRHDDAREAFEHVARLVTTGRHAWIGPFRLAEVAAWQRRPDAFEDHAREALRRGFSFRTIAEDPNWARFYADPEMRDSVEKLVTVYGTPDVLESLRRIEAPPASP